MLVSNLIFCGGTRVRRQSVATPEDTYCIVFLRYSTRIYTLRVYIRSPFQPSCPGSLGSCSPVCPLGAFYCVCSVLSHLAPAHRAARCVCGVQSHFAPVHGCARSVLCAVCAASLPTWRLSGGVLARCVVLRVRCPGIVGSRSPLGPLGVLCCACGVLGHVAPVQQCARPLRCVSCAVSWATWLLFTGVPAWCVVLPVPCPGPLGSCSPVCSLSALRCVCGVMGHLTPLHRCACSVHCVACAVSWASRLLFADVLLPCVVLRVPSPGPLGSCSPVCQLSALCCVCGVPGHLATVHWCAFSVRCVVCALSSAT